MLAPLAACLEPMNLLQDYSTYYTFLNIKRNIFENLTKIVWTRYWNWQLETDISWQEELMKLIKESTPGDCKFLTTQDPIHADIIISFLCLLNSESFPLNSICYMIFCDLIQGFSLDDKQQMTYTTNVKNFWVICKVLFKDKFSTFFRGETGR